MTEPQTASTTEGQEKASDDVRVGSPQDVLRLLRVTQRRFAERPEAVTATHFGSLRLLLTRRKDGVFITVSPEADQVTLSYLSPSEPACWLTLDGDQLEFDDQGEGRSIQQLIDMLESFPVALPPRVPYGVVSEGEIVGLIWDVEPCFVVMNGKDVLYPGTDCYVLEGRSRPDLFDRAPIPDDFDVSLWEAVDRGSLVRLGSRLNSQQGPVNYVWDGSRGFLELHDPDDRTPTLAPGGLRYVSWSLGEESPGSSGRAYGEEPFVTELRGWFSE